MTILKSQKIIFKKETIYIQSISNIISITISRKKKTELLLNVLIHIIQDILKESRFPFSLPPQI